MRNSFLETQAKGKRALIIVPHEDDEINLAGSLMYDLLQKGVEVFCAFTTNGDYSFRAETRMKEAAASLRILGVRQILFLGYGDTSNQYTGGHVMTSENDVFISPSGHHETYGAAGFFDFAFLRNGRHHPYVRASFLSDMEDLLLAVHADMIFCVDCDVHADHRAASMIFEEAMGHLLQRPENDYKPLVFKGFAYATSFGAPCDFYALNILSVPHPEPREDLLIDSSVYDWKRRVRFPVLPCCRGSYLRHNLLYRALFQHASQSAALHAVRIVNGDAIFWQRRTDNLAYRAEVQASSGVAEHVVDFRLYTLRDLRSTRLSFAKSSYWCPSEADGRRMLTFRWKVPQTIAVLCIWGPIEAETQGSGIRVSFDTGYEVDLGCLPPRGRVLTKKIPVQQGVHSCTVELLEKEQPCCLAQVEFYETSQQCGEEPFIKMEIDGRFVYEEILPASMQTCRVQVYAYGIRKPVHYQLRSECGSTVTEDGVVHFATGERQVRLRAEIAGRSDIFDEITLTRCSRWFCWRRSILQQLERLLLRFYLKKYRKYTHIRHKYLKKL